MTEPTSEGEKNGFDDYYSMKNIRRFERIFSPSFISMGSLSATKEFCFHLNLKPGEKVLDIGCGTGGAVLYMARHYGCRVRGLDLCNNMISLCNDRLKLEEEIVRKRVEFQPGDVMEVSFANDEFDVIYSRGVFLHIKDKKKLFSKIVNWLKPGGKLLITDLMRGNQTLSSEAINYLDDTNYQMDTWNEYTEALKKSGFILEKEEDLSERFIKYSQDELKYFIAEKEGFIQDFTLEDYEYIVKDWSSKIHLTQIGEMRYPFFICSK